MQNNENSGDWLVEAISAINIFSATYGTVDDSACLLAFLCEVMPSSPELVTAQVRINLIRREYREARELIDKSEIAHPGNALLRTMSAICLFVQGDPLWESVAAEAVALPQTAISTALIDTLSRNSGCALSPSEAPRDELPTFRAFEGLAG